MIYLFKILQLLIVLIIAITAYVKIVSDQFWIEMGLLFFLIAIFYTILVAHERASSGRDIAPLGAISYNTTFSTIVYITMLYLNIFQLSFLVIYGIKYSWLYSGLLTLLSLIVGGVGAYLLGNILPRTLSALTVVILTPTLIVYMSFRLYNLF